MSAGDVKALRLRLQPLLDGGPLQRARAEQVPVPLVLVLVSDVALDLPRLYMHPSIHDPLRFQLVSWLSHVSCACVCTYVDEGDVAVLEGEFLAMRLHACNIVFTLVNNRVHLQWHGQLKYLELEVLGQSLGAAEGVGRSLPTTSVE
jgi:hypothetical protein